MSNSMKNPIFLGSGAAVCTPFDSSGMFDPITYDKIIKFHIDSGTDAIIACGTTGEVSTLDFNEHVEVAKAAVDSVRKHGGSKSIPVISGAGGNDTRHTARLAIELEKAGVDGLMLVTPYYNKTSQRGLVEHFAHVAAGVSLPIIVYNVPGRTGMNILPATAYEISKISNAVGIKEASGNIVQIAEIIRFCGDALHMYSGEDSMVLPTLALGGKGVISTIANIAPQQMHKLCAVFFAGDVQTAAKMQLDMLPLIDCLFADINPMPVKTALNLMGFNAGPCRGPLTTIDDSLKARLIKEMQAYGLQLA